MGGLKGRNSRCRNGLAVLAQRLPNLATPPASCLAALLFVRDASIVATNCPTYCAVFALPNWQWVNKLSERGFGNLNLRGA